MRGQIGRGGNSGLQRQPILSGSKPCYARSQGNLLLNITVHGAIAAFVEPSVQWFDSTWSGYHIGLSFPQ
jgi:hypothetical protein